MKLIFEKSQHGRRAGTLPSYDLPAAEVPDELRRSEPPRLPELAEPEIVRHFTALADRTFGVDTGFYPLGSCTMKHNPRVNERVVALPGFRDLHPLQEEDGAQGALELMIPIVRKLVAYAMYEGQRSRIAWPSSPGSSRCGTAISRTSSVIAIAKTPSENASSLPFDTRQA